MVPYALCVFQDSEAMCLTFKVFLCLVEPAAIQVLPGNTTTMVCEDWRFVLVQHLTFWLSSSVKRPNTC